MVHMHSSGCKRTIHDLSRRIIYIEVDLIIVPATILNPNKYFLFVHPVTNVPKHEKHNTTQNNMCA